jgi:hypothetical protein
MDCRLIDVLMLIKDISMRQYVLTVSELSIFLRQLSSFLQSSNRLAVLETHRFVLFLTVNSVMVFKIIVLIGSLQNT